MKYILWIFCMVVVPMHAAQTAVLKWKENETFAQYLKRNHVSTDILEHLSKEDVKSFSNINTHHDMYELKKRDGTLLQALIPLGKKMQIHLHRALKSQQYSVEIVPVEYDFHTYFAKIVVKNNPYVDTLKTVKNKKLAKRISSALSETIESKKLQKNDKIDFVYTQRTRMGKPYLMPHIKVARVTMRNKKQYVYVDKDGNGFLNDGNGSKYTVLEKKKKTYTKNVKVKTENSVFGMPLKHIRITSTFSYKRFHPILHCYKPHHGTDFGVKMGTPLLAVNSGTVTYAARMGTYGNVVKIRHGGGYESLYAHQSRVAVKRGQHVVKGQVIGYAGSTGRSTGPHLHFGLMKNGKWIDPMTVLGKKSIERSVKRKFIKYENIKRVKHKHVPLKKLKKYKKKLLKSIKHDDDCYIWND